MQDTTLNIAERHETGDVRDVRESAHAERSQNGVAQPRKKLKSVAKDVATASQTPSEKSMPVISAADVSERAGAVEYGGPWVLSPDSLARRDSIREANRPKSYAVVMEKKFSEPHFRTDNGGELSLIYLLLVAIFVIVCLRFRKNSRYMRAVLNDLLEVRDRQNIFDGTVRETSFMLIMNLLWMAGSGVVIYKFLAYMTKGLQFGFGSFPSLPPDSVVGMSLCMGVMLLYTIAMSLAYWTVGNVFSDRTHTISWVKGFWASQAMAGIVFLPLALLLVSVPAWTKILLILCGVVYLLVKLLFIYKGFRIFFNQISSWLLFLYYLCSLELVPLILTILGAFYICSADWFKY